MLQKSNYTLIQNENGYLRGQIDLLKKNQKPYQRDLAECRIDNIIISPEQKKLVMKN